MPTIGPTKTVSEQVFTIECYFPEKPFIGQDGKRHAGRWTTCYGWVYACGSESSQSLSTGTRGRLAVLQKKHLGYSGRRGTLNLHYEGLAYATHADALEALSRIRAWKSCRYRCRIMRETVWKEQMVLPGTHAIQLPRPFKVLR